MYCIDIKFKRTQADSRWHCKTMADVRYWIKDALKCGDIYPNQIKVYHGWGLDKVDVTQWALEPLKSLIDKVNLNNY